MDIAVHRGFSFSHNVKVYNFRKYEKTTMGDYNFTTTWTTWDNLF